MPQSGRDLACVWDILKAALLVRDLTAGMDRAAFESDVRTHFAVIAQLQIIGEAAKRLTESFRRAHPSFPWADMAKTRDFLIHHYDRVDLEAVWRIATESVPALVGQLEAILPSEDA